MPVLLLALAGLAVTGGVSGGAWLWNKAMRMWAAEQLQETTDLKKAALLAEMDLAAVKAEAKQAGVPVEVVLEGIEGIKRGEVTGPMLTSLIKSAAQVAMG